MKSPLSLRVLYALDRFYVRITAPLRRYALEAEFRQLGDNTGTGCGWVDTR